MRAAAAILMCVTVLSAACGGGGDEDAKGVQLGWKTHRVDDGGFSIDVPASWRTIDKVDPKGVDEFVSANPQFAAVKKAFGAGLVKLLAADPDMSSNFATNVNVVVHNLGRTMTLPEYARATLASERPLTPDPIRSKLVRTPAGRCLRLEYDYQATVHGALRWLALLQYAYVRGQSEYVVTFTTLPAQKARYRRTFARSASSFRFD